MREGRKEVGRGNQCLLFSLIFMYERETQRERETERERESISPRRTVNKVLQRNEFFT